MHNTLRRGLRLAACTFALYAAIGGITAGEVKAHASLIGTTPAYQAALETAPETVELIFDNLVEPGLVKVRLKDATDTEIGKGTLIGTREPRNQVQFSLPTHGDGSYLITWVSFAFDGHIISGTIPYTVGVVADGNGPAQPDAAGGETGGTVKPPTQTGSTNKIIDVAEIQTRFLSYVGFAALFGALLWGWALGGTKHSRRFAGPDILDDNRDEDNRKPKEFGLTESGAQADSTEENPAQKDAVGDAFVDKSGVAVDTLNRTASGARWVGLAIIVAALVARGGVGVWRFFDGGYTFGETLRQTWGGQLSGYVIAIAVVAVVAVLGKNRPGITAAGVAVAAALSSSVGHAASENMPGINSILMGVHLIAAGTWVGGVGILAYAATERTFSSNRERWVELAPALKRVSGAFIAAVVVLAATGTRAAFVYNEEPLEGRWGTTLTAKLTLAVGAGLIGLYHSRRGARGESLSKTTIVVEACLLTLVLTAAAVLSVTAL